MPQPLSTISRLNLYNFKATVAYRGTAYKGWQIQNGMQPQSTIQGALEKALTQLKNEPKELINIQGAGRTDAGVHARGQVFNFYSANLLPPPEKLSRAVNSFLPGDIRVMNVARVPSDFHARYSALSKTYSFHIQQGAIADPLLLDLSQHVFQELDVDAMKCAAKLLEGTHDFTQFSSASAAEFFSPVKRLAKAEVTAVPNGLKILFLGSGFLYNQCRHMVGCLIRVGLGKLSVEHVQELLCTKGINGLSHRAWTLASACGLYLENVQYPVHADFEEFLYPEAPHDEYGRLDFGGTPTVESIEALRIMRHNKATLQEAMVEKVSIS